MPLTVSKLFDTCHTKGPLEHIMFSAALEWLGQEHRIDPAVLTNRVLIQLNDGDNVIGRNSLALADPKYDGLHSVS